MSQALPPGTIAATRTDNYGACADSVGVGTPGPGAACFTCPPGYLKEYRTWGMGARDGSWNCIPLPPQGLPEQIAAPAGGSMNGLAALAGFTVGIGLGYILTADVG